MKVFLKLNVTCINKGDSLDLGLWITEGLAGFKDELSSTFSVSLLKADFRLGLDTEVDRLKGVSFTLL